MFYQLLAGLPTAELAELHLDAPLETFRLVNQSGCVAITGQVTRTPTPTLTLTLTLTLSPYRGR